MKSSRLNNLWDELKRRNVPRVATVYTITSWVVIDVANTVFPPLHIPEWVLTVIIILLLIGFPIVLLLAWVFELGPNREPSTDPSIPDTSPAKPRKRLWTSNFAIVVLLLVVVGQFVYFDLIKKPGNADTETEQSIAVIPFDNLTNDPEMESFSDGMTGEVISHLSKIAALKVTSRTSIKGFKGTQASIADIAGKLSVNHILVGSIRKSGSKIRITAELIDAKTDKNIWSEDYDYLELKDIFHVQSDVSTKVAEALKARLTPLEVASLSKNYTENVKAYQYYLKGRNFWDKRSKQSYDSAEANFQKAIDTDPQYALAYSGLADCYTYNQKGMTQLEAIPIAKAYALKALQLDSNLCQALTTIGFIQSHFDYQWEEAKHTLEKAILCDPNYPTAHVYLGNILLFTGKTDQGLEETKKALALDPLSLVINMVLGRNLYYARKYDTALAQLQKTLSMNPNFLSAYLALGDCYIQKGNFQKAIETYSKLPQKEFDAGYNGRARLSYAIARSGNKTKAVEVFSQIPKEDEAKSPVFMSVLYIGLGEHEKSFEKLALGYEAHTLGMIFTNTDPLFDPIRKDARFEALLKKMNFK